MTDAFAADGRSRRAEVLRGPPTTAHPAVHVIVVNWNGVEDTVACIESCEKLTYPNVNVVLVDNGSTDGSQALIRARFPDLTVIANERNLGFAGGSNAGIRYALDRDADYVVLLNNDTVVDPEFATELVSVAQSDESIGLLCSKTYFFDRPDVLWYAGGTFHRWLGWSRHRGFNQRDRGQFDGVEDTQRACGCALMVRSEVCRTIGLLREEYFCYCEDLDWSLRALAAHYRIVYVPASRVWHKVSRSTGGAGSGVSHYYHVRNMLWCLDANTPLASPFRFIRCAVVVVASVLSLFTQNVPKIVGLGYLYRGVSHYFHKRMGELG